MRPSRRPRALLCVALASGAAACPIIQEGPVTVPGGPPPTGNVVIGTPNDGEVCFDALADVGLATPLNVSALLATPVEGSYASSEARLASERMRFDTTIEIPELHVSPEGAVLAVDYQIVGADLDITPVELWTGNGPEDGVRFRAEDADFEEDGYLAHASVHHDDAGAPYAEVMWDRGWGGRLERYRYTLEGRSFIDNVAAGNRLGPVGLGQGGDLHVTFMTPGGADLIYGALDEDCELTRAVRVPLLQPFRAHVGFREDGEAELVVQTEQGLAVGSTVNPAWSLLEVAWPDAISQHELAHDGSGGLAVLSSDYTPDTVFGQRSLFVRRGPEWTLYPLDHRRPVCGVYVEDHPACPLDAYGSYAVAHLVQGADGAWVAMATNYYPPEEEWTSCELQRAEAHAQVTLYRIKGGEVTRFTLEDSFGWVHEVSVAERADSPHQLYLALTHRTGEVVGDGCENRHYLERVLVTLPEEQ